MLLGIHMHPSANLTDLYRIVDEQTRSITAENPEGHKGQGGQAASELGPGRKGQPCLEDIDSGSTATLGTIDGPGIIRHLWITVPPKTGNLTDLVFRIYWDRESEPSVEVPLGDFFCNGHDQRCNVTSLPIVVAPNGGMNSYFPMPFAEHARITVENQHDETLSHLFYQIDYSLVPELSPDVATFHAQWRRENPTTKGEDYTILDQVDGVGHYVGTYLAWTTLSDHWWGEGEVKFYIDGDDAYPTICGTGTEDYVGGAWCFTQGEGTGDPQPSTYSTPYLGYPFHDTGETTHGAPAKHGLYRWHIPDPIRFTEDLRVTVQQIGARDGKYVERSDDISSVAYWYQREPHTTFPDLPAPSSRRPR